MSDQKKTVLYPAHFKQWDSNLTGKHYVIHFRDFPGISASSPEFLDALRLAERNLQVCIRDMNKIPSPSTAKNGDVMIAVKLKVPCETPFKSGGFTGDTVMIPCGTMPLSAIKGAVIGANVDPEDEPRKVKVGFHGDLKIDRSDEITKPLTSEGFDITNNNMGFVTHDKENELKIGINNRGLITGVNVGPANEGAKVVVNNEKSESGRPESVADQIISKAVKKAMEKQRTSNTAGILSPTDESKRSSVGGVLSNEKIIKHTININDTTVGGIRETNIDITPKDSLDIKLDAISNAIVTLTAQVNALAGKGDKPATPSNHSDK